MAVELQSINPDKPNPRLIKHAVEILQRGGVIVYPTDTIYGLGADLFNKNAMKKISRIKDVTGGKLLTFICPDLQDISSWAYLDNPAFRIMRRVTPGKYTFVLNASRELPKTLFQKRRTVGIRIPDAPVALALARELGRPLLSTSVPAVEGEFCTDPREIAAAFRHDIDLILDAGIMANEPSTIVDLSGGEPVILRQGAGELELLFR